uniref:Uncharacterized protein n=1 Tax=Gasterosteus aculeatus aculeatus TaxID=481459 RepID=A0AAQ4Q8Z9_GASAC
MHPLSTVESVAFRQLISKIPVINGGSGQMCRKTFSSYLDREYAKMQVELKKTFEGLQHVSTTAEIWTAYNKSFLGVTAHWINPFQGALPFTKKRELTPGLPPASPESFASQHWEPRGACLRHSKSGNLNPASFSIFVRPSLRTD